LICPRRIHSAEPFGQVGRRRAGSLSPAAVGSVWLGQSGWVSLLALWRRPARTGSVGRSNRERHSPWGQQHVGPSAQIGLGASGPQTVWNDAPSRRWQKHTRRSTGPRPKQIASQWLPFIPDRATALSGSFAHRLLAMIMCARAAAAPTRSGFTIRSNRRHHGRMPAPHPLRSCCRSGTASVSRHLQVVNSTERSYRYFGDGVREPAWLRPTSQNRAGVKQRVWNTGAGVV